MRLRKVSGPSADSSTSSICPLPTSALTPRQPTHFREPAPPVMNVDLSLKRKRDERADQSLTRTCNIKDFALLTFAIQTQLQNANMERLNLAAARVLCFQKARRVRSRVTRGPPVTLSKQRRHLLLQPRASIVARCRHRDSCAKAPIQRHRSCPMQPKSTSHPLRHRQPLRRLWTISV